MSFRRLDAADHQVDATPRHLPGGGVSDGESTVGGERMRLSVPVVAGPSEAERLQAAYDDARETARLAGLEDAEAEIGRRVQVVATRLEADHKTRIGLLDAERQRLLASLRNLEHHVLDWQGDSEDLAIEIAYAALTQLLGPQQDGRSAIAALCAHLVETYGRTDACLHVSETDAPAIAEAGLTIRWEIDRSLAAGEAFIDTDRGQFETSLASRLEAIKLRYLAGLAQHRGEAP